MILAILVLGLVLRLISLDQSLWLDEATSVKVASTFSFQEIVTNFSPGDFHPPLYYLLLKIWVSILGTSEIAVRSLSVIFGVATIPFVFLVGKKLVSKEVGLIAALLFTIAPLHIYYSQEARMYAMATFFVTLFVWLFLKSLDKEAKSFNWVGLFIVGSFLSYTHYLALAIFSVVFVYLLLNRKQLKENLKFWVLFFIAIALVFSPWLQVLFKQFENAALAKINTPLWWEVLGKTSIKQLALVPVKFLIGRISTYDKVVYSFSVVLPLLLASFLIFKSTLLKRKVLILWLWLIVPVIFSAIFGWVSSGFSYFRLLFVLPAFYLLIAAGIFSFKNSNIRKMLITTFVLINLASSGIYLFNPRFHREDWRSAIQFVEKNSRDQKAAAIFVTNNQRDPYFYYAKSVPSFGSDSVESTYDKIWLVRYLQTIFDPKDEVRKVVEKRYEKIKEYNFNGVVIWEYKLRDQYPFYF